MLDHLTDDDRRAQMREVVVMLSDDALTRLIPYTDAMGREIIVAEIDARKANGS
jgi:hypothetical protein